jgi:ribonuclease D
MQRRGEPGEERVTDRHGGAVAGLLGRDDQAQAVARDLAAAGRFALDLEFVSEARYVPDLCLIQVAWGAPEQPQIAVLDPLTADVTPVLDLLAVPEVEGVLHAAQGDLALLATRHGVEAKGVVDTQIAAAFLGLGDQVGYGSLVEQLTGVSLDKGAQFTNWCRRPLTDEQLRYALDDVRYLLRVWHEMEGRLRERGRLAWVRDESERLARAATRRQAPEEMFRRVKGWERLPADARGGLRALAAWREREALASNRPPQWLLRDAALLEVARRRPASLAELRRVRAVSEEAVRRHGRAILGALGASAPPPDAPRRYHRLPLGAAGWGGLLFGLVQGRCRELDIAPRFVASRADVEELVRWWVESEGGERAPAACPDLPLLAGWRRDLVGQAALDWLAGQTAVAADPSTTPDVPLAGPPEAD